MRWPPRRTRLVFHLVAMCPTRSGLLHALDAGQVSVDHLDNYLQALVTEQLQPVEPTGLQGIGALMDVIDEGRIPQLVEATRAARAWVVPTNGALGNSVLRRSIGDRAAHVASGSALHAT